MDDERIITPEEHEENIIMLISLLLANMENVKHLRIPIKMFQEPDYEKLLKDLIEIYQKNGFINNDVLKQAYYKNGFDYSLFTTLHFDIIVMTGEFYNSTFLKQFNWYQNKILLHYKQSRAKELHNKLTKREISLNEYTQELNKINDFKLEDEENIFRTIKNIPREEKEKVYIKSNTIVLDNEIKGFALGELTIWSGGNASSKSTYLNQLILEAITQNFNVAVYSGELTNSRLLDWLYLQASGINNLINKNGFYKPTEAVKQKIDYWLDERLFVFDDRKGNNYETLIEAIRYVVENKCVKMVIIDNMMSLDKQKEDNLYQEQSNLTKVLSKLCKELDIHIHFVCHPRKTTGFLRKNDIAGSSDISNLADNIIIMHRVNSDFVRATKEMFGWKDNDEKYSYTNIMEICKNREFGVVDKFIGLYFENGSRRLLNKNQERKIYGWEQMR